MKYTYMFATQTPHTFAETVGMSGVNVLNKQKKK